MLVTSRKSDGETDQRVSRLFRWRTFVVRSVIALAMVTWGAGTLLWGTLQDAVPYLSGVYYALPMPVLIVAGAIVSAASLRQMKDCRVTAACLLLLEMRERPVNRMVQFTVVFAC